jgi:hypothetical protein
MQAERRPMVTLPRKLVYHADQRRRPQACAAQ